MNKKNNIPEDELLTPNQITFLIVGIAIGVAFIKFPNALVKHAYQDAWISALIGLLYPLYILLISNYIIKKYPNKNILEINRDFFGHILGNILNILFMLPLSFYIFSVTSDYMRVNLTYIVAFLTQKKVLNISLLVVAYTAYKGLKPLSKVNEYVGYMILGMILLSGAALKYGNIGNLMPVFQAPIKDILNGSVDSLYFFTAFESLLLYHDRAKDKSSIKKASFKGLFISTIVWLWCLFITIYYLGVDIIPKSTWSFIMVFESIHLPIINNFRYVFMFVWTLICLRVISNFYYFTSFVIGDVIKKDRKKVCIAMYIPVFFICNKLGDSAIREKLIDFLSPIFVIFNVCFLTILALIIYFKSKKTSNQND